MSAAASRVAGALLAGTGQNRSLWLTGEYASHPFIAQTGHGAFEGAETAAQRFEPHAERVAEWVTFLAAEWHRGQRENRERDPRTEQRGRHAMAHARRSRAPAVGRVRVAREAVAHDERANDYSPEDGSHQHPKERLAVDRLARPGAQW